MGSSFRIPASRLYYLLINTLNNGTSSELIYRSPTGQLHVWCGVCCISPDPLTVYRSFFHPTSDIIPLSFINILNRFKQKYRDYLISHSDFIFWLNTAFLIYIHRIAGYIPSSYWLQSFQCPSCLFPELYRTLYKTSFLESFIGRNSIFTMFSLKLLLFSIDLLSCW